MVSSASILTAVDYIHPVVRPVSVEPQVKLDGRRFNKGSVSRTPHAYVFKANIIDEYLEKLEECPGLSQDELNFALSRNLNQSQISTWVQDKDKLFEMAAN